MADRDQLDVRVDGTELWLSPILRDHVTSRNLGGSCWGMPNRDISAGWLVSARKLHVYLGVRVAWYEEGCRGMVRRNRTTASRLGLAKHAFPLRE